MLCKKSDVVKDGSGQVVKERDEHWSETMCNCHEACQTSALADKASCSGHWCEARYANNLSRCKNQCQAQARRGCSQEASAVCPDIDTRRGFGYSSFPWIMCSKISQICTDIVIPKAEANG